MEGLKQRDMEILLALSQDGFLASLESALERLSEKRSRVERPSWYSVEGLKDTEEENMEAMCGVLEVIGRSGGDSEERLATLLNSSGLQEDRTRLLLAQRGHLEELASVRKENSAPPDDLVDIQWKLGVVAASSQEGDAGRTFVQVNFISQPPGQTKRNGKVVEMSLEKFYDFLHQLEKCKTAIEHSHLL